MTKIARMDNMSHSVMSESYLKQYTPVIVTDAMENWKAMEKFNIKFLDEVRNTSVGNFNFSHFVCHIVPRS